MLTQPTEQRIETWPIERLVEYPRNPRKNDKAVDRMCASIREFGFKIPCLVRSDGEVVDGHLRLKAARKLGIKEIPVILCDEWTSAQVKAFRLLVNRSVTWADWDEELLALELQEIQELDLDLSLTGFDPGEIDKLLLLDDEEQANATPPLPESPVSRPGDLWLLGPHRLLCGDATCAEAVARLLGERKPRLMVTDPPYGIELDSEWRDRAGLNGCGPAEASYMKKRTSGHTETTISGDTRADWSDAFALMPTLEVAYVWHASRFTREVLDGLLRIGFLHHQQIIWNFYRVYNLKAGLCCLRQRNSFTSRFLRGNGSGQNHFALLGVRRYRQPAALELRICGKACFDRTFEIRVGPSPMRPSWTDLPGSIPGETVLRSEGRMQFASYLCPPSLLEPICTKVVSRLFHRYKSFRSYPITKKRNTNFHCDPVNSHRANPA